MNSSLESLLQHAFIVGYSPMSDEPEYEKFLSVRGLPRTDFRIPASKEIPPAHIEQVLREKYLEGVVAIFMPGQAFDVSGTRHGRGHGWYDRLLAGLPNAWIRIGVTADTRVSEVPLVRKAWDQPVDFLLIEGPQGFEVHATDARSGVIQS